MNLKEAPLKISRSCNLDKLVTFIQIDKNLSENLLCPETFILRCDQTGYRGYIDSFFESLVCPGLTEQAQAFNLQTVNSLKTGDDNVRL